VLLAAIYVGSGQPFDACAASILIQAGLTAVCGFVVTAWLHRKLGGMTGDTYGALNEVLEAVLLFAAIWLNEVTG
jgi:adenosylcobinamide-GDP ribazoletransferase